jgi:hypothetical protein
MMSAIFLEDTIATLCQLHPPPLVLVPPPICGYQPEHIFVLDKTLFAQALPTAPHFFSNGLFTHWSSFFFSLLTWAACGRGHYY